MGSWFGQQQDAQNAETGELERSNRLVRMAQEPWPRFLLRVALQIVAVFAIAALVFWLLGR